MRKLAALAVTRGRQIYVILSTAKPLGIKMKEMTPPPQRVHKSGEWCGQAGFVSVLSSLQKKSRVDDLRSEK